MGKIALILIAASPLLYEAQVQSFGCNSSDQVSKLQQIRSNPSAFQTFLYQQVVEGECVVFEKGSVVEGSVETGNSSLLHIQAQIDPPGYIAPSIDFKLKEPAGQR
jgi:hypothetical protein